MNHLKLLLSFLVILSINQIQAQCVASLNVTPTSNPGEFTFTDNSNFGDYSWLDPGFGSGVNLLPSPSVTLTYPANGTYNYSYFIFDSLPGGCSDTIFGTVIVTGIPCTTQAAVSLIPTSNPGEFVIQDASTNVSAATFYPDSQTSFSNWIFMNLGGTTTYQYPANGTYTYGYMVYDSTYNCFDSISGTITVTGMTSPCSIVAGITITPTANPGQFTLTDNSTGGNFSYMYPGFGSSILILPNPSATVTYPTNGNFSYYYVVTDSLSGCMDTVNGMIAVTNAAPCNVQAGLTITQGSIPGQYVFTDNSINATQGSLDILNPIGSNYQLLPSNPATHTFTTNGTHYYHYVVFNGAGCGDTIIDSLIVTGLNAPCPSFAGVIITPTSTPGQITITDNSSAGQFSYFDHGAGGASVLVLPNPSATYTYPSNGVYNYAYIVVDSMSGCMDTTYGTTTITGITNPTPCSASFILLQDSTNASQYYCWNTATNSNGTIGGMTYLWDFGDGNTSNVAYPVHTYNSLGSFTLCLTISDATGCTSTYCDTVVITVKASGTTLNVLPAGANLSLNKPKVFQSVSLYPNPASGATNLAIGSSVDSEIAITVMTLTGQVIYSENMNIVNGENEIKLDLYDLSSGVYMVSVKDSNSGSQKSLRLIKN